MYCSDDDTESAPLSGASDAEPDSVPTADEDGETTEVLPAWFDTMEDLQPGDGYKKQYKNVS